MNNVDNTFKEKAILAAIDLGEYDVAVSMDELEELAETAGLEVIAQVVQKRDTPEKSTLVGEGKLGEIAQLCKDYNADLIVIDHELTASQIRNIEKVTETRVLDRTMLILDIFAMRAVTSEGKLQVELAQLKHRLPRLVGMGVSLSRQGSGGSKGMGVGTRGPGESKLESDRRHIRKRIEKLTDELNELKKRREFARSRRKKDNKLVAAIVGYTNTGKSTLLNKLTNADVMAEDMLFATLDPTSRGIELPDGREVILVDTVGMIRRLPHNLVEAFKSTLEEAANADIILHVCDVSDPEAADKADVVLKLLSELGCADIPIVTVYNKSDLINESISATDNSVAISAKYGNNLDNLLQITAKNLTSDSIRVKLLIPYDKGAVIAKLRDGGKIFAEEFVENGTILDILIENKIYHLAEQYVASEE